MAALDVKVEGVARRFHDIAFSDFADIVALHYGACRYCDGIGHACQERTHREFKSSLADIRHECALDCIKNTQITPEGGCE